MRYRRIGGLALAVFAATSFAPVRGATRRTLHVDCAAADGGDGTRGRPLASLADVAAVALSPGDRVLLRRGTTCTGTLAPSGVGSAGAPIRIGAYGSGARPRILGAGEDAVLLRNTSHAIIEDLEIENRGDFASRRRGIHVIADASVVENLIVRRLYVHDVEGDLAKDSQGSGGIQVDVAGGGRFEGLVIERNRIEDVSRSGIFIVAGSGPRPRAGEPWPGASTGVVVRRNRLTRLGGDGIVPLGTVGAVVEDNVVSVGNLRGHDFTQPDRVCNAGIWAFDANDTLIQRNEVYGMRFSGCDGTGFDIDYAQDGTVVQYNYSHDNEGGFILLCTDPAPRRAEVRFNLSVDDAFAVNSSPCAFPAIGTYEGVRFFNNTIVGDNPQLSFQTHPITSFFDPDHLETHNNVFFATTPLSIPFPCAGPCERNLSFGLPPAGANAFTVDPMFRRPRRRGPGRLRVGQAFVPKAGSVATGSGLVLPGAPQRDYFGRPIPSGAPPVGFAVPAPSRVTYGYDREAGRDDPAQPRTGQRLTPRHGGTRAR